MEDVTGYRPRYVTWQELEQQRAASEAIIELALQSLRAEQATPARSLSPFLRYHAHCPREVCPLAEREGERLGVRLGVIESARLAVLFCRAGL
jgi:hypothetical protein